MACLHQIEFSDNYIIGLPSREPNPAFVELVAVGGSTAIPITGLRLTGNIFRSSGAHPTSGALTAFKVNEMGSSVAACSPTRSSLEILTRG